MKNLFLAFWLISSAVAAQTTVSLPVLRGGDTTAFNNSAMTSNYTFIDKGTGVGFYKLMAGDVTTVASDTVFVKADNTRWKLLSSLSPSSVTWASIPDKPTLYTSPSGLKAALESLSGSARLDTSAIKNLRGITTESDPNVGSHVKAITTDDITAWNAKYGTGAAVVSSLSALSGTNRLPFSALKDVPAETDPNVGSHIKAISTTNISDWTASYRTGAAVVSSLSALSGTNRLPASAIKDLPTVTDNSTIQKIETRVGGTLIGTRKSINLIAGSNVTVTGSDNSGGDRVDITLSATGGGGTGMAEPSANGLAVRTSSGASAARSIVAPAAGITITNGDGVSGNPTLVLADDLAGIEGLSSTGYVKRTGTGTFSAGTAIDLSGSEVTGTMAAGRMPALAGDIITTAGAVSTSYNNVVPANKGGAGSVTGLMKANGSGTVSAATAGTDYVVPSGNITGSAAYLTTARSIYGNNFDGSAALTQIIASGFGGTGNGFTKFSGAASSEKTYTLPNVNATILTDNAAVTVSQGGTNASTASGARTNLGLVIGTDVAPVSSPAFAGTPTVPTAAIYTNTTQAASTAFVNTIAVTKPSHKTITEVRAFTANDVTNNPRIYITDAGKEGEFRYVAGSSNADNTGTVLVTTSGSYRFERVVDNNTYRADWFKISGDPHTGTALRRAVNAALAALSAGDSNVVVTIGKGRSTIDTTYIKLDVPKWKKLTIVGEPGNIVDFYNPESPGAVFRTNVNAYETDSTYNFGVVELKGLNFYGGRNPTGTYLSENYGVRPVWIVNAQGVIIHGCSFRKIYGSGVAVGWSRMVNISNNTFENVFARQPNLIDATGDAISTYARIRNLVISGNIIQLQNGLIGRCGISVDDRCWNFVVSSNVIQGYERGIHIENCRDGSVTANIVTRSPMAGVSAINRAVIWANNVFDSDKAVCNSVLSSGATFWTLNDTLCAYRGNTIRNWTGQSGTYLARIWSHDSVIENNTFEPNRANAEVYGYGYNYRNTYRNNEFRGGAKLRVDYTYSNIVEDNNFYGGTVQTHESTDVMVTGNKLFPDYFAGSNTGSGLIIYNSTRPYVSGNIITNAASYVIENTNSTDGVFENNTYLRKHSSAVAYSTFFVSTGISATGAKKTAADRYNVIRDYVGTPNTYYVGNTGTPTAY